MEFRSCTSNLLFTDASHADRGVHLQDLMAAGDLALLGEGPSYQCLRDESSTADP